MALRFASTELADHFMKIADGLETFYLEYDYYLQMTRGEYQADMKAPPIA